MIKYIASYLIILIVGACHPSPLSDDSDHEGINHEVRYSGVSYVFKDVNSSAVIAIYIDEGLYRSHADISEVGNLTDIGGMVSKCNSSQSECIDMGGNYIIAPQEGVYEWSFSDFNFKATPDEFDPESLIITSSRRGEYQSSYKYNKNCGIDWIVFAYRDDLKHETFRPVGRSLFSRDNCSRMSKIK